MRLMKLDIISSKAAMTVNKLVIDGLEFPNMLSSIPTVNVSQTKLNGVVYLK